MGEIIIAKHRNGSLDSVFLRFIGQYIKFVDPISHNMDPAAGMNPDNSFENGGATKIVRSKMNDMPDDSSYVNENENNDQEIPF